jgi:hypothetical protein
MPERTVFWLGWLIELIALGLLAVVGHTGGL